MLILSKWYQPAYLDYQQIQYVIEIKSLVQIDADFAQHFSQHALFAFSSYDTGFFDCYCSLQTQDGEQVFVIVGEDSRHGTLYT